MPLSITWEDGRVYGIDRVRTCAGREPKGWRGRDEVHGEDSRSETYLFNEDGRWVCGN